MGLFSLFKKALGNADEDKASSAKPSESDEMNVNSGPGEEPKEENLQNNQALEEGDSPAEEPEAAPEPECSIYEYIKTHTEDGRVPEGFCIPWIQGMWAPGAQDGVCLYHMVPLEPDPAREQQILHALELMSSEESLDYVRVVFDIFEEIEEKIPIVRLYDEIIQVMIAHKADLNLENLLNYGDWLISYGVSLLSVKLGLTLISPFNVPFVEEVMTEFGVYDEFTYYAARVLSLPTWDNCNVWVGKLDVDNGVPTWQSGNDKLFNLAKNVRGWGRIHAVEYLRPETQEIRDWLLYEGADNDIIPQYSADVCLQKSGAESRLDSALSAKEFEAIGELIQIALESGPRPGITDGERILPKFLAKGEEFPIDPRLKQMILDSTE